MGFKKHIFQNIVHYETKKFGLDTDFRFPYTTVLSQISRDSLEVCNKQSHFIFIEDKIVEFVLCMSNIKRSLSVSEGLSLVNEFIVDTNMQERLIMWKLVNNIYYGSLKDLGRVGKGYWNRFLKRNRYRLRSKRIQKCGSDRSNYSSNLNF